MAAEVTKEVLRQPRVTHADMAIRLNVDRKTIYRWVETGFLPKPFELGNIKFWTEEQVDQWEENWIASQGGAK